MTAPTPIAANTPVNSETTYSTIDPGIYVVANPLQRAYNLPILDLLHASFMDDTKERQFLDVGCGTGDFTRDHLLPRCTPLERMVAVDVSEEMVEYAKKHFAHPKVCYDVLDIAGNGVADFVKRYGQFDRVYSFHCLQRTNNQEAVLQNIAGLLKPSGGCLLLFGASATVMRLNKRLATMDPWKKYRKVFENAIPPSVDLVGRDALLSYMLNLLKNAGLVPTTCELLQRPPTPSSPEEMTRTVDVPGTNAPAPRPAHRERRVESSESPEAAGRDPSDALAPANGGTSAQSALATILAVLAIGVLFVVVVGLALFLDTDPAPKARHALNKTSDGSLPLSSGNGSLGIPDVISFRNRR